MSRHFAERDLWNVPAATERHSGLIFANLITLAHFSVSSAMSLPKSAGEPGFGTLLNAAYRDLTSGSARPALISTLSFWMISTGVPFGAPKPPTALASYPGTKSPTVGSSGSASERLTVVTASALNWPALIYPMDETVYSD